MLRKHAILRKCRKGTIFDVNKCSRVSYDNYQNVIINKLLRLNDCRCRSGNRETCELDEDFPPATTTAFNLETTIPIANHIFTEPS